MKADNNIIATLQKAGYRLTKPRLLVLRFLSQAKKPCSANEMHQVIKSLDLASVYRTAHLLRSLKLVTMERRGDENVFCLTGKPHHHIVCSKCGYTETVVCSHHFNNKNFINIEHQLLLTGVCDSCQKKL